MLQRNKEKEARYEIQFIQGEYLNIFLLYFISTQSNFRFIALLL